MEKQILLPCIHIHPSSMPPSGADFNSAVEHGYMISLVLCHDGKIIQYMVNERIPIYIYERYVSECKTEGLDEYNAQWEALVKLKKSYDIDFWEVRP